MHTFLPTTKVAKQPQTFGRRVNVFPPLCVWACAYLHVCDELEMVVYIRYTQRLWRCVYRCVGALVSRPTINGTTGPLADEDFRENRTTSSHSAMAFTNCTHLPAFIQTTGRPAGYYTGFTCITLLCMGRCRSHWLPVLGQHSQSRQSDQGTINTDAHTHIHAQWWTNVSISIQNRTRKYEYIHVIALLTSATLFISACLQWHIHWLWLVYFTKRWNFGEISTGFTVTIIFVCTENPRLWMATSVLQVGWKTSFVIHIIRWSVSPSGTPNPEAQMHQRVCACVHHCY